jgi:hypothetical protein
MCILLTFAVGSFAAHAIVRVTCSAVLQTVNEFRAFRLEAAKHGVQFMHNPGQFWGMVLGQGRAGVEDTDDPPSRFDNMFKLHLLSVLILTSSTDVERAFSHHKQILGVKRTSLHVKNIDSRLRGIELVKPILKQNGYKY